MQADGLVAETPHLEWKDVKGRHREWNNANKRRRASTDATGIDHLHPDEKMFSALFDDMYRVLKKYREELDFQESARRERAALEEPSCEKMTDVEVEHGEASVEESRAA